jgi:uncharacterized membrane protein
VTVMFVLGIGILITRILGVAGVEALNAWPASVRAGLAVMLLFTASAHFTSMRHDLASMVPRILPHPMAVIYFTGVCEILGAIGLLLPRTRAAAGAALIVMFLALLPANIRAATTGVTLRGKPATPLAIRVAMQFVFIGLTWWAAVANPR